METASRPPPGFDPVLCAKWHAPAPCQPAAPCARPGWRPASLPPPPTPPPPATPPAPATPLRPPGKLKFSMAGGTSFHSALQSYTPQMAGDSPADRLPIALALRAQQAPRAKGGERMQEAPRQAREQQGAASGADEGTSSSDAVREEGQEEARRQDGAAAAASGPPAAAAAAPAAAQQQLRDSRAGQGAEVDGEDGGLPPLRHPRSAWLRARLPDPERHFRILARVGRRGLRGRRGALALTLSRPGSALARARMEPAPGLQGLLTGAPCAPPPPRPTRRFPPRTASKPPPPPGSARAVHRAPRPRPSAQVADIAHAPAEAAQLADALRARAHVAAAAKAAIELDRNAAAAEEGGYATGLFKVLQADGMAKSDLLVGVPPGW
jgi:hypothetical protein